MNRNHRLVAAPFALDFEKIAPRVCLDPEDRQDREDFEALLEKARQLARPKALWKRCVVEAAETGGRVRLDGVEFFSRTLAKLLAGKAEAWVYCATCGKESDALLSDDPLARYWADEIRIELLQAALKALRADLESVHPGARLSSLAPGSGETEQVWSIAELHGVFELAEGAFADILGVELTDTFLMLPTKTVAGVFFVSEDDFLACEVCKRVNCPNRRAPFDEQKWMSFGSHGACE